MKPRSHSLNQVVCVTMTAIDVTPTISVQRKATTCRDRRAADISEGLTDAEVDAPVALLRITIDPEVVDLRQLVAEIESRRSNRREIAQARTDGVTEIADVEVP